VPTLAGGGGVNPYLDAYGRFAHRPYATLGGTT
jgi:hypothetical protein